MIYYVIPARSGSKGIPYKNRILLGFTLKSLSTVKNDNIIITSDDYSILEETKDFKQVKRLPQLSNDTANIRDVLIDVVLKHNLKEDDTIVSLYLTYPERKFEDIDGILRYFENAGSKSLLCKQKVKENPYLMIDSDGKKLIDHDLYRRQDYPKFYNISHFVAIIKVSELYQLNKNLYNEDTDFYYIDDKIDIDTKEDLERFLK